MPVRTQTRFTRCRNELARLPQVDRGNPHRGQQVASKEQHQPLRIHAIVLESGRGNGLGLLRVREHRVVPEALQQVHQPPPRARGLDGDPRRRRERSKELLDAPQLVLQAMLGQSPLCGQHRDL